MALLTVEGHYSNGHIDFKEQPAGVESARVIVTFLPDDLHRQDAEAQRQEAMNWLFARMKQGIDFGGEKFDRNELYEQRMQKLDARRGQAK